MSAQDKATDSEAENVELAESALLGVTSVEKQPTQNTWFE